MDAYQVGITIFMTDRVTSAMSSVSRAMLQAGQHTDQLKQKIKDVGDNLAKLSILQNIGANMFHGGMEAMEVIVHHAKEYNFELNKMESQGIKIAEINKNIAAAQANSTRDLTTTYAENLSHIGDLTAALGSTEHAREILPAFTDAMKIIRTSGNMKVSAQAEHMTKDMARAGELAGDLLPGRSRAYQEEHIDMMRRSITALNGMVTAADFHGFNKNAGVARYGYNDDYKYRVSPYFYQELGGQRAGTQNAAINQSLIQGVMTVEAALRLQKAHLLNSGGEQINKKTYMRIASHGILGQQEFKSNPFEALTKIWIPQMLKDNPRIAAITDKAEQNKEIAGLINQLRLNKNTTQYLSLMAVSQTAVQREREKFERVPKRAQAVPIADKNVQNVQKSTEAQFANAMTNLGKEALPLATRGMNFLARVLNQINQFMVANPMAPKIIAAAIAAVTLVGGVVALYAAFQTNVVIAGLCGASVGALAGWITLAVAGITGLILAIMHWDKVVKTIKDSSDNLFTTSMNNMKALQMGFAAFFGSIGQSIANALGPIGNLLAAGTHAVLDSAVSQMSGPNAHLAYQGAHSTMTGMTVGAAPSHLLQPTQTSSAKGGKIVNNFNTTIHQQPGEDSHAFSKKVANAMVDHLRGGLNSSSAAGGIFESQWHHGGNVGG
jgi:hypothetical protein